LIDNINPSMRVLPNREVVADREECLLERHPGKLAGSRDVEPTRRAIMKPEIKPISDLSIHVIKPRLTQPEEVDQVLMAMMAQDLATCLPTADGAQLVDTVQIADAINGACDQVCCRWRQDCFDTDGIAKLSAA
jgi:hypothetical protein